jgi:uncharacterized protein (TIGR02145 family)
MKSTGTTLWQSPNTAATNESGFTGLPAGLRDGNGAFDGIGNLGLWWSSSESNTTIAWYRAMDSNYGEATSYSYYKDYGYSVRCIKD